MPQFTPRPLGSDQATALYILLTKLVQVTATQEDACFSFVLTEKRFEIDLWEGRGIQPGCGNNNNLNFDESWNKKTKTNDQQTAGIMEEDMKDNNSKIPKLTSG